LNKKIEEKRKTRSELSIIMGRQLEDGQVVHHIDMDKFNNEPENLYIYDNDSEHQLGHGSLNRLVKHLLKEKIITFQNKLYCINEYEFLRNIFKEDPDFTGSVTFNVFKGGLTAINKKENIGLKKFVLWLKESKEREERKNEN